MSEKTPNLSLPFLAPDQAQKHVTVNQAFAALDELAQISVINANGVTPPAIPVEGEKYIIANAATDEWADKTDTLAVYRDGAWVFHEPKIGWIIWNQANSEFLVWAQSGWQNVNSVPDQLQNIDLLGVGTSADATNPFSARLNNALWTALYLIDGGTGDLRFVMNKENAGKNASIVFQSNWQGRAEIGLTGTDDFTFKVSADGNGFLEAILLDKDTAKVKFPQGLSAPEFNQGPIGGFRNLLINGEMAHWQRGVSFSSVVTDTYFCDRWFGRRGSGATGLTVSRQNGFSNAEYSVRIQRDAGLSSTDRIFFAQQVESSSARRAAGKTAWVSADIRAGADYSANNMTLDCGVPSGTGVDEHYTLSTAFPTGNLAATLTKTITSTAQHIVFGPYTIPADVQEIAVLFRFSPTGTAGADDYIELTNIQLEAGTMATPFEHRTTSLELDLCRRYFQRISAVDNPDTLFSSVYGATSTNVRGILHFSEKRKIPIISASGAFELDTAALGTFSNFAFARISRSATDVNIVTTGTNLPSAGAIRAMNDTSAFIDIDAEL